MDPTSPFSGDASAKIADDLAVGMAFWLEPAPRRMAKVAYLSGNKNARRILLDYLTLADRQSAPPRGSQIRLYQPAPGVIEGSVTLTLQEAFEHFLFAVFAMLGHAIYL